MKAILCFLCLIALGTLLQASGDIEHVLKARSLLGADLWSKVLKIQETSRTNQVSYALVFEFNRVLWYYSPLEGTRSLSHRIGRAVEDKQRVLDLVKSLFPKLLLVESIDIPQLSKPAGGSIPNGCFISSIAALRDRASQLGNDCEAFLFSYYWRPKSLLVGHTVLLLKSARESLVVDLSRAWPMEMSVEPSLAQNPKALAETIDPDIKVLETRLLPVYSMKRNRL